MRIDRAWLLMRAEARGLSGILTASTPTDFKKRAPSISFETSVPFGGTTSTMVTNSPRAIFAPRDERLARDVTSSSALVAGALLTGNVLVRLRASPTRSADFMVRV